MEFGETLPEAANFLAKKAQAVERPLPKIGEADPKLVEAADKIAEISGAWNPIEIYTADPDSIKQEQEKFFKAVAQGQEYNPQFVYSYAKGLDLKQQREDLMQLLAKVRKSQVSSEADKKARVALYFKIKDDLATCDLVDGIKVKDDLKIAQALARKYRGTDPVLIAAAQKEYERLTQLSQDKPEGTTEITPKEKQFLQTTMCDAEEIKSAFAYALKGYGLLRDESSQTGYTVVIDEKATDIDVRDKSVLGPTIFIPKDKRITTQQLLMLIAHEIEGHARQSANGEKLFKIGGGRLKVDDETLYSNRKTKTGFLFS